MSTNTSYKITFVNPSQGYNKYNQYYIENTLQEALECRRDLQGNGFTNVAIRKKKGKSRCSDFR